MAATIGRTASPDLAGGGIAGGVLHGSSDRYAAHPATYPVSPSDIAATVYHCLGVDPKSAVVDKLNRPMSLCDGEPIAAILENGPGA